MSDFSERLQGFVKRSGMTQEQLSERLPVTLGTVSRWLRGRDEPGIYNAVALAIALGVRVEDLIPEEWNYREIPQSPKAPRPRTAPAKLRVLEGGGDDRY